MQIGVMDYRKELLHSLEKEFIEKDINYVVMAFDIRDNKTVQEFYKQCIQTFESIDILINNAGITHIAPQQETSIDDYRQVMDVNFMGLVQMTQAFLPSIIAKKGIVIGISSVAGYSPLLYRTAYAASKHAVWGYLSSLRSEMLEKNVTVITVCPSFVRTELQESQQKYFNNSTNETLQPKDVADAIFEGIVKRKDHLFIGKTAQRVYLLNRFFPKLYERIMRKKMKIE